jgi:hypothetical protein
VDTPHSFGDFHGIDVYHGYMASMTRRFYELRLHEEKTRKLFGVRYYVAPQPFQGWNREVYASRKGWKIWENPDSFPRVFTVHSAVQIHSEEDIDSIYRRDDRDLRTQVFLYSEPPKLESCAESDDSAWLLRREADLVRIAVRMECRGMVVLPDTYFPGWRATVDGRPAEIHAAYTALRGVVADRGWHFIEMRYRPRSVYWGAALTAIGLIGAALTGRLDRRTSRLGVLL